MCICILHPVFYYRTIHGLIKMEYILIYHAYAPACISIYPVNASKLRPDCIGSIEILGPYRRVPKEVFQTGWCNQLCPCHCKALCEGNDGGHSVSAPPGLIHSSVDPASCRNEPVIGISRSVSKEGCVHLLREMEVELISRGQGAAAGNVIVLHRLEPWRALLRGILHQPRLRYCRPQGCRRIVMDKLQGQTPIRII